MNRNIPILFKNKSECCACGACINICPQRAISMQEDECGFLYPFINEQICVRCGKCRKVCTFQNTKVKNEPLATYAAVAKDLEILSQSASGGVSAVLAKDVIEDGGVVVGAVLQPDFSVKHMLISHIDEISMLQGSKYVQSNTEEIFTEIKTHLNNGQKVLFSGTPCQVSGLQGYLGQVYENLITIDIICHGVPSNRMFQEYIKVLESKNGGAISSFTFRDKKLGWGINGSVVVNGHRKKLWQSASSYLYYFSKSWIYRENCYQCKYACSHRPADLTVGDYWGIEKQHPEYIRDNGWDESKGISAVIVNTEKGRQFLKNAQGILELKVSEFEKVAERNEQLKYPSKPGKRADILDTYSKGGWVALEKNFKKTVGWRYYSSQIKAIFPTEIKRRLKAKMKN